MADGRPGDSTPSPGLPISEPLSYIYNSDLQETSGPETATVNIMVDGRKLQHLLRPKHRYYADKWGSVASFAAYEDSDENKCLLYPKVKITHRENPYRKMQLRRQTTGRTARAMLALVENNRLYDFRVADIVLTYPREASEYLAKKGKRGREYAWRVEKRFWRDMAAVGLSDPGAARSVNLHPWKTENPLLPHFHFHEMIPNYVMAEVEGVEDEDGNEAYQLEKR